MYLIGLPEGYAQKDWRPPVDVPCIIQLLCDKHEGLVVEAKGIKEHWWKPYIKKLFDRKVCGRQRKGWERLCALRYT